MCWAEVTVGMKGNDAHSLAARGERVELAGRDGERHARREGNDASFGVTQAAPIEHYPDPHGRVGVRGLVHIVMEAQQVEAGVAAHHWRDKQGIGATIDVVQAANLFNRSAKVKQAGACMPGNDDALALSGNCAGAGDGEVHAGPDCKGAGTAPDLRSPGKRKTEMRITVRQLQNAIGPCAERRGKFISAHVAQQAVPDCERKEVLFCLHRHFSLFGLVKAAFEVAPAAEAASL
jgi:hypothetical protein